MKFFRNKTGIFLLLLIILCFFTLSQAVSAESNSTNLDELKQTSCCDLKKDYNSLEVLNENTDSKIISNGNSNDKLSNSRNITLFIISDNPGTNILDKASNELFTEQGLTGVKLIVVIYFK